MDIIIHKTAVSQTGTTQRRLTKMYYNQIVKVKGNFKSIQRKANSHLRNTLRIYTEFSGETLQFRKEWDVIIYVFQVKKKKKTCQPKILHSGKLSFKNRGEIKSSRDKQKLRKPITTRLDL